MPKSKQVIRLLEIARGIVVVTPDRVPAGLEQLSAMLAEVRDTMRADVAFVARFDEGHRHFVAVSKAEGSLAGVEPGGADPLLDTYCRLVVERRIPPVVRDTQGEPLTARLEVTKTLRISAYVGAPVYRADGALFGTLCAIYHETQPGLGAEIGRALRHLADQLGQSIGPDGTLDHVSWSEGGRRANA
ncbi:MAG: hypothetical protein AVDCRST_MAG51-2680 [uncultured Ramlibacter sp.]|uniref:GAF domain-containing protein n=1 Tax=uncultured Ramlibacter sp. TaxID=260755 RepID=A0A6J4Q4D5_9BURK|nr:MAG: hypothetical protein AVDCRST_MAG51-2680 [uncultured Ramlibacter sp.]